MSTITETLGAACPECGHIHEDADTWDESGDTHCDECGFYFGYEVEPDCERVDGVWYMSLTFNTWDPKN